MTIINLLTIALTLVIVSSQPKEFEKTEKFCDLQWTTSEGEKICDRITWNCPYVVRNVKDANMFYKIDEQDKSNTFYADLAKSNSPGTLGFFKNKYKGTVFELIKDNILKELKENGSNAARISKSLTGYQGCYKVYDYVIMDKYTLPLEFFFSNYKSSEVDLKIAYFKRIGEIFKGVLIAVTRLHTPMGENEVPYYIQAVKPLDFGVFANTDITLNDVMSSAIVIRKTENVGKKLIIPNDQLKYIHLVYDKNRRYTADETKNINYGQIFDYFLDVLYKYLLSNKFKIIECFAESEMDRVFYINDCPAFMLMSINLLPDSEREALVHILKNNNLKAKPEEVQKALFHIFDFIANYSDTPETYNPLDKILVLENFSKDLVPEMTNIADIGDQPIEIGQAVDDINTPIENNGVDNTPKDEEEKEQTSEPKTPENRRILMYVGIGFGILVVIGVIIWFFVM